MIIAERKPFPAEYLAVNPVIDEIMKADSPEALYLICGAEMSCQIGITPMPEGSKGE